MRQKNQNQRIPVKEQTKDRLYEMSIRFRADAVPVEIANLTERCGFAETPVLQNAITLRMSQIVPFIPDDETLDKYAQIIADSYESNSLRLVNVKFEGYDYIYAVE